ncbi:uncharacterized protein isoform X2 [Castor canadensis]|uniref:Uncharacterized protein isoform X2 n=1 Tax=Castor canadensis TaxID=51338 RepID=A0AC58L6U4_CASCN
MVLSEIMTRRNDYKSKKLFSSAFLMESGYSRGTCTSMFIAALFTIAKLWKQPRCPTTDEWIKKMWYLYTMEFYAAMKKNEMLSFAGKWMELENIILSEALCNPEFRELNKTNGILALQELLLRQQKEQKKNSVAPPMDVKVPRGHLEMFIHISTPHCHPPRLSTRKKSLNQFSCRRLKFLDGHGRICKINDFFFK